MNPTNSNEAATPSERISRHIEELNDWRGIVIARLRRLILEASPGIREEWKWGTAVWSSHGLVCSTAAFKDHVKVHFFQGASLADPRAVFNAGLDGAKMRAIDIKEGQEIDEAGLMDLVRTAVAFNEQK